MEVLSVGFDCCEGCRKPVEVRMVGFDIRKGFRRLVDVQNQLDEHLQVTCTPCVSQNGCSDPPQASYTHSGRQKPTH